MVQGGEGRSLVDFHLYQGLIQLVLLHLKMGFLVHSTFQVTLDSVWRHCSLAPFTAQAP